MASVIYFLFGLELNYCECDFAGNMDDKWLEWAMMEKTDVKPRSGSLYGY